MHDTGMYLIIMEKIKSIPICPSIAIIQLLISSTNECAEQVASQPAFGEENLLGLALDRYDDESIGVHEFCHTIDSALESIDPTWRERLNETYREVRKKDCTKAYAGSNPGEYWAEICQAYFDCNRVNNYNHDRSELASN